MLHLAANVSTMFREHPFAERFQAASAAGFTAVEAQYPYELEPQELRARLAAAGLELVLINAPAGKTGEKGMACLPGREVEFRASVERALAYLDATGCRKLHVLSGVPEPGDDLQTLRATLLSNLRWAAEQCAAADATMVLEALNESDAPGYIIPTQAAAAELVLAVDHPRCRLLFDVYHCLMQGDDPVAAWDAHGALAGHVQIADAPGRGEPGTGRAHWNDIFARLARGPYDGPVGCEYIPVTTTGESLAWIDRLAGVSLQRTVDQG